jgi:succinate dehydrogenase / fumarate reductase membrane anchor subunit
VSLRAPLARALNHGAAHDGTHHWMVQRVTALAIAPLAIWLLFALLSLPDSSYATAARWIQHSWNAVPLSLLVLLASWHGWLGMQMVIEDYIDTFLSKTALLLLSAFVFALLAASGVYAVLRVALRGVP